MMDKQKYIEALLNVYQSGYEETTDDVDLIGKFIDEHYNNQLTVEEIDFLLMSEEERVNTYKNADEIWKSCVSKLEKQKEVTDE